MGVVPDVNAIRTVSRQQNKSVSVSQQKHKRHVPLDDKFDLTTRLREIDDKLLEEVRQDDLDRFLSEFQKSEDLDAIINGDAQLIAEYKQNQLFEAVDSSIGKDVLLKAAEERLKKSEKNEKDVDSDGDIVVKKKSKKVKQEIFFIRKEPTTKLIYRDQDGFQITREKWLELQSQKQGGYKVKKKQPPPSKKLEPVPWGAGLAQTAELEKQLKIEERIANEPLTRYEIDAITDKEFREAVHWADPMRKLINNRPAAEHSQKLVCPFNAPQNRFGILPGYRWDGVVRGNGYEDKILKAANKRIEDQEKAYIDTVEFL